LIAQRGSGIGGGNPLGSRPAIGGQQPGFHTIPVELPAGVTRDALQAYIYLDASGEIGKARGEHRNIGNQPGTERGGCGAIQKQSVERGL
jgi:hypothetical protein